jgi:hypothetical protein
MIASVKDTARARPVTRWLAGSVLRGHIRERDGWPIQYPDSLNESNGVARPAGLGTVRGERSESRRFPKTAGRSQFARANWRARQDSNLRPPA